MTTTKDILNDFATEIEEMVQKVNVDPDYTDRDFEDDKQRILDQYEEAINENTKN